MKIGLWIDHNKAVIVSGSGKDKRVELVESGVNKHAHPVGLSRSQNPYGRRDVPADDIREREFDGHLKVYYDKIISRIRGADAVLILGPGESKTELKKRMVKEKLGGRIAGVLPADKMSSNRIAAEIRDYFAGLKQ